jgi:UrcA family protein
MIFLIQRARALAFSLAAVATMLTVAALATPVSAAEAPQLRVDISRYNLASDRGRDRAIDRLRRAAVQVCDQGDRRSLASLRESRVCTAEAMARVMPRLELKIAAARIGRTDVAAGSDGRNNADSSRGPNPVRR